MVEAGTATDVVLIAAAVGGLWVGARLLVGAAVRLARGVGLSELLIGLTVVAVGTSSPELVVTVDAALVGAGALAVGNVVGSNLYNLAVVLGVVALVRVLPVDRGLVRRDGLALLAATLAGAAALFDLVVSRLEGVALLALLVGYVAVSVRAGTREAVGRPASAPPVTNGGGSADSVDVDGPLPAIAARSSGTGPLRDAALLVVGLAVVLASGHLLVEAAVRLARAAGVSEWAIGATVVAAGTSTPEFAVSIVALRRGSIGVSVGNVVGSNVFNLLGAMGLAAVVAPLSVGPEVVGSVAWLVVLTAAVVAALWSGRRLSRVEGAALTLSELARWTLGLLGIG